jgi:hypothetical protein
MGWYRYKRKKKKGKPGFWTIVTIKSPDGHEVKVKLNITPEAIKKWFLLGAVCRGSGEARSVSDLKIKNRCRGRIAKTIK